MSGLSHPHVVLTATSSSRTSKWSHILFYQHYSSSTKKTRVFDKDISRNHPQQDQESVVSVQPGSPSCRSDMGETSSSTDMDVISKIFPNTTRNTIPVGRAHKATKRIAELAADTRSEVEEEDSEQALIQEEEGKEKRKEEEEEQGAYSTQSLSAHDTIREDTDTDTSVFADELELAVWTELPPSPTQKKRTSKKQRANQFTSPPPEIMPPIQPIPLLICSIGNPGSAYANTLHSAGHTLITSLASMINASPFSKDRAYANGTVSLPSYSSSQPQWTLFQSGAYMNESGKPIAKAYTQWSRTLDRDLAAHAKVVILHDELERPLGNVIVREGQGLSAKGHNGIKSLLQTMGKTGFVRVGVGIGRPAGRGSEEVAAYVLRKMTAVEKERVGGAAVEVLERLRVLSGG